MIKILVVDDEPDVKMMFLQKFRAEIKNEEYVLNFALSAEEAIEFMESLLPFDIVLVLSDINMPGMNGLQLLKRIRLLFPNLKVFMISAYGDSQSKDEATHLGANDFITKPIDFQILKHRIKSIIEQ